MIGAILICSTWTVLVVVWFAWWLDTQYDWVTYLCKRREPIEKIEPPKDPWLILAEAEVEELLA